MELVGEQKLDTAKQTMARAIFREHQGKLLETDM